MLPNAILIVDDDRADRYLLRLDLARAGIRVPVFEAEDADQALALLAAEDTSGVRDGDACPAELIFLDLNMPRANGFDFLERYAAWRTRHPDRRSSAVIVFTSSPLPSERSRALDYGFVADFLIKGETTPEELGERIRRAASAMGHGPS